MTPASLTSVVTPVSPGEPVVAAAFLGDAPAFALADGTVLIAGGDGERRAAAHPDAALLVAASDGRRLVTGGDDGRLAATDASGAVETLAEAGSQWIDALAARADGACAWSAGRSVFARSAKGEIKTLAIPSTSRGLAFFPKGYRLAIAHYNGVALWFPGVEAKPETLEWKGSHLDATVSPDGRFVVTSMQENTLHGWRLADGKNLRMAGYPGKTRSFSWSHDGKWLATSGADACILLPFQTNDGPMGQPPRECGVRADVMATRVAFHPGALVAALGYEDGLVMLARITDGAEILVRAPSPGSGKTRVSALAWEANGGRLAFGTEDGQAGVLTLPKS